MPCQIENHIVYNRTSRRPKLRNLSCARGHQSLLNTVSKTGSTAAPTTTEMSSSPAEFQCRNNFKWLYGPDIRSSHYKQYSAIDNIFVLSVFLSISLLLVNTTSTFTANKMSLNNYHRRRLTACVSAWRHILRDLYLYYIFALCLVFNF